MKNIARMTILACLVLALTIPATAVADGYDGSYKLVKRTLTDGTEIGSGDQIMGFMTLANGWRNFHVTWMEGETRVSIGMIAEYELSDEEYCETVHYWISNNAGAEGLTYEVPEGHAGCTTVTMEDGGHKFQFPGEPVVIVMSEDGFTATGEGVFVDTWERVD